MSEEIATKYKVLNELRKLFQKNDEWIAWVWEDGNNIEISMSDRHLGASWASGGTLPFTCINLINELGWSSGNGVFEDGVFKVKLYPGVK